MFDLSPIVFKTLSWLCLPKIGKFNRTLGNDEQYQTKIVFDPSRPQWPQL